MKNINQSSKLIKQESLKLFVAANILQRNVMVFITLIGLLLSLISPAVFAQYEPPANVRRGAANGASYSVSDIETINLTNGNLMLNIPLAELPKGRGSIGQSLSLMYNSKLYSTGTDELMDITSQMSLQTRLLPNHDGGWHYVRPSYYTMEVTSRLANNPWVDCNAGPYEFGKNAYLWKVEMTFPDGSRKLFRPSGYSDYYADDYYNITANGYQYYVSSVPDGFGGYSCSASDSSVTASPMTYYSTDGSYMKLVVDHDSTPGNKSGTNNTWTLYLPDGGKITGGIGTNTRIYDRNGNYVEGMTDNVGRSITITAGSTADEDLVKVKGFDNEELVCTVKWKTIYIQREYETQAVTNDNTRGNPSEQIHQGDYRVIDEIILPPQMGSLKYEFEYYASDTPLGTGQTSSGWGEIKSIKLPSGAETEYEYKYGFGTPERLKDVLANSVKKKTLTYNSEYDGTTTPVSEIWTYDITKTAATITSPDGNVSTQTHGDVSYEHQMTGLVRKIENSNGTKTEKLWDFNGTPAHNNRQINPFVKAEFTSIKDSSNYTKTAIKEFSYDKNGNQTQVKEYDFIPYANVPRNGAGQITGLPGGITPVRIITNTYNNSTPDSSDTTTNSSNAYWNSASPNLRNAVAVTEVKDGSNNVVSRSEFSYDNASTTGNLTEVKTWDSTKGSYSNPLTGGNSISVTNQYDAYGNLTQTTDAKGIVSKLTYGNITTPTGSVSDLYPTQSVTAFGTAQARTTNIEYDFTSGAVKQTTDADNGVSTATEYDDLARPTKVKAAVGTANEVWTQTVYDDFNRRVIVKSDLEVKGDAKKVAIQHFDQLGRVRLSRTLEDASTEDATDEADGIKVQTRYKYDNPTTPASSNGTYSLTSNPYRASTSAGASSEEGMGWTLSYADKTGKTSTLKTYGGATLPAPFGANSNLTGTVTTEIDENTTTVTDQAGKLRRSVTNALGQLIRVDEPNDAGQLGTVSSPNQATSYAYDTLNNLTTVTQGGQTRTFSYNSLSRLTQAVNPESGTISYVYDNNGNLTSKTDARSVVTSYTYDNLNRVTQRSYSDSTPTVTYTYDDSGITYAKGRLTKVSSSISETKYTSFDNLGRLLTSQQITDGNTYNFAYSYNLSGALVEETYPSGRKVKNSFQVDGALGKVETQPSGGSYSARADNFTYTAAGMISSMQLGNAKWENAVFNSRLQPTQLGLGNSNNTQELWKVNYDYGTTDNNGNVKSQTITVPTITAIVQDYTYDSLNRIKSAEETVSSSTIWKQTFDYDRFGNRRFDVSNTTTIPGGCSTAQCNPTIDTANNRFTSGQGYTYDASGNLLTDAEGRTFNYDAENKQKEVKDSGNNTIGEYFFDGDGKRVKKVSPNETTLFVYDASAKLVAEYLLTEETPSAPTTSYLTSDTLGSPRIVTDASGNIESRRDFMPFGEEISAIGGRNSGLNYQIDEIRQKFTGYERDNETDLDFAQARMYSNSLGRFTTTDPIIMTPVRALDPQRINLYVYVRNNPLILVDTSGEDIDDAGLKDNEDYQKWKAAFLETDAGKKLWDKYNNDKSFLLKIDWKKGSNGAETHSYKFSNGKLTGATITLGSDIDDAEAASKRDSTRYPLSSAVGENNIVNLFSRDKEQKRTTMAITVIAHEFGHVEDAYANPSAFQIKQEYSDLRKELVGKFGNTPAALNNSELLKKQENYFKAFGVKNNDEFAIRVDTVAEKTTIPVIQQRYANVGKTVPPSVQNAINKFQRGQ